MRDRSRAQGITVSVAVAMPLFVSLVGLALDAGHLYAVHTDLQAVADAAARAGAAQLNTTGGGALRSETGNPPQLDPAAAEAAATAYAVYQGVEPVSVVADVQQVAVHVGQTVPMVFLRVLHINSRWIEARGVAHPRAGVATGEERAMNSEGAAGEPGGLLTPPRAGRASPRGLPASPRRGATAPH